MNISIAPGRYVVAVSGGMDSMVLLDLLVKLPGLELVVAHFDHGIREDSGEDRLLVESLARKHGLPFATEQGHLGQEVGEAAAREARYEFLRRVMRKYKAQAIITAHHQDDSIETAIINMIRGTGRKGLDALQSTSHILRPLLHLTKEDLYEYARQQSLQDNAIHWREDSTNASDAYLRNYIRHHIITKLSATQRQAFVSHVAHAHELNTEIDGLLLQESATAQQSELDRRRFIMLPYDISCEVMAAWLRLNNLRLFDRKTIARLVVMAKVAAPGKVVDINAGYFLKTEKTLLRITRGTGS